MLRRVGVSANRAIPWLLVRARWSTPNPTARTARPLRGVPKRLRAVASTIDVLPARSTCGAAVSVLQAILSAAALTAFAAAPSVGAVIRTSAAAVLLR